MKKQIIILVTLFVTSVFIGCSDNESLPGPSPYTPPGAGFSNPKNHINVVFNENMNVYFVSLPQTSSYPQKPPKYQYHDIQWLENNKFTKNTTPETNFISKHEYYRTQVIDSNLDSKFGLLGNGKEIISPYYKRLDYMHAVHFDSKYIPIFKACTENKCLFYFGEKVLPGTYSADHTIVGSIQSMGASCDFDMIDLTVMIDFNTRLTRTSSRVDSTHKEVITDIGNGFEKFQDIELLSNKRFMTCKNDTSRIYNCSGELIDVIPYRFVRATKMPHVYIITEHSNNEYLHQPSRVIDSKGNELLPIGNWRIEDNETVIAFSNRKKLGVILAGNHEVRYFKQDAEKTITIMDVLATDRYLVQQKSFGVMDSWGNLIIPTEFNDFEKKPQRKILMRKGNNEGIFDLDSGKLLERKVVN